MFLRLLKQTKAGGRKATSQLNIMSETQLELFAQYEPSKPSDSSSTIIIEIDSASKALTDQDIDNLEKIYGRCPNDDDVGLFELIRMLKREGAKRVKLI